jgi:hypothetical protein
MLTDHELDAGGIPAVGDTVILADWMRCQPHTAISSENIRGLGSFPSE